jgi:hypothetical protein
MNLIRRIAQAIRTAAGELLWPDGPERGPDPRESLPWWLNPDPFQADGQRRAASARAEHDRQAARRSSLHDE